MMKSILISAISYSKNMRRVVRSRFAFVFFVVLKAEKGKNFFVIHIAPRN